MNYWDVAEWAKTASNDEILNLRILLSSIATDRASEENRDKMYTEIVARCEPLNDEERAILKSGDMLQCIKHYRYRTAASLQEAHAVATIERQKMLTPAL